MDPATMQENQVEAAGGGSPWFAADAPRE
jgi:hypothetical protein